MFDAARKDGIYPVVWEGYRTYEEQQKILDDKIKAYINEGYSQSRAERTAKEWVALPGTSEHQLGIAVDINADKSKSSNDEVYTWLAANAHNYGFILRYPQGKQEITGTSYEPWHYRYVGVDAARFDFPSFSFFKINLIYNGGIVDLKALVLRKCFLPVHILSVDTNDQFLHLSSVTS